MMMKIPDILQAAERYGSRFKNWLAFVLEWECVFNKQGHIITENVLGDGGGITFAGIDHRSHPKFNYLHPTPEAVAATYFSDYWKPSQAEAFKFPVGEVVANFSVNMGLRRAVILLQTAINQLPDRGWCVVDGKIGGQTIGAAAEEDAFELADKIEDEATKFYRGIVAARPSQKKFLQGWLNRNAALERWWRTLA